MPKHGGLVSFRERGCGSLFKACAACVWSLVWLPNTASLFDLLLDEGPFEDIIAGLSLAG